jgi:hypothetical protein
MTRYLLISDIHANLPALEAVLKHARGRYDQVVCLGDTVGFNQWSDQWVAIVREEGVLKLDLDQLWPFYNLELSVRDMCRVHVVYDQASKHMALEFEFLGPLAVIGVDIHDEETANAVRSLAQGSELAICIWPMGPAIETDAETVKYYEDDFQLVFETRPFVSTVSRCDLM